VTSSVPWRHAICGPGHCRLLFRIGVHLGDVMAEGDDVFGDGVNVAARLQSLAEAGGVRISRQAYDQVEGKLGVTYRTAAPRMARGWPTPRLVKGRCWSRPRTG
jgi:class 3 adenylate cyclase